MLVGKTSENIFFSTCILPDYVSHESLKEFWKNSHFENMRAGFLKGVKTHFGKLVLKLCIFRHEKNFLTNIVSCDASVFFSYKILEIMEMTKIVFYFIVFDQMRI